MSQPTHEQPLLSNALPGSSPSMHLPAPGRPRPSWTTPACDLVAASCKWWWQRCFEPINVWRPQRADRHL